MSLSLSCPCLSLIRHLRHDSTFVFVDQLIPRREMSWLGFGWERKRERGGDRERERAAAPRRLFSASMDPRLLPPEGTMRTFCNSVSSSRYYTGYCLCVPDLPDLGTYSVATSLISNARARGQWGSCEHRHSTPWPPCVTRVLPSSSSLGFFFLPSHLVRYSYSNYCCTLYVTPTFTSRAPTLYLCLTTT